MTSADGWNTLGSIMRANADEAERERRKRPSTCPNDGEILEDVRGVLHCRFGGEIYDYAGNPVYGFQL